MVSIRVVLVVVLALVAVAQTLADFRNVAPAWPGWPDWPYGDAGKNRGDRHRRVTCDLLSVDTKIGSMNHAACAAHCLAMFKGYRGGRCRDGVCHCRR